MNPSGEIDRVILREGAQVIFPASESSEIMAAVQPGASLTIWGIRARSAAVITMLAWARTEAEGAHFVAQPSWFVSNLRGSQILTLSGTVDRALLNPQGDPMGVLLIDGAVVRLSVAAHLALAARLAPGQTVLAEGTGTRRGAQIAIDAARLGADGASLQPVPVEAQP